MTRLERKEEDSFSEKAKELRCITVKLEVPGQRHWPDRLCFPANCGSRVLLLEMKRQGKKPRKAQYIKLRKLRKIGVHAYWADNDQKALRILKRFIEKYRR